uniref:Transposase (Putative), gypsy type n=1 Tax=Tanacetum cinerariifolium TaxID=118510 RepID=A0A6L2LT51_TANCI|nr:hypothetical protein [Tanacetum cinerariifolium]
MNLFSYSSKNLQPLPSEEEEKAIKVVATTETEVWLLQHLDVVESCQSSTNARGGTSVAACIRLYLVCPSCLHAPSSLHAPSTGCGPDVCDIRTSYVRRQFTSSDGDSAALCLLRRLATPDWLLATKLETLIGDIPLDLRTRLPDPNFRMINLQAGDTAICIYFRIFDSSGVRIAFSSFLLVVFKYFKVHISQLVPLGLSKTLSKQGDWFSFAKRGDPAPATIREEPHGLDTSILGRVTDRTTSPSSAGTAIPRASPKEIVVTRPDPKVVTKADHAAKRKTFTRSKISTNAAKKTKSSQKVSGAGSIGLAAGDGVGQTDDGTLDDDGQSDGSEFAMEDIRNLDDIRKPELSRGVRRDIQAIFHESYGVSEDASSPTQEAMPALATQPLDADVGADEIASDGNVDPYYEARVSNTTRDVLERDLIPFVPWPYYLPYPYDEGFGIESPPYSRDDWEEIHGVNLSLQKKELYKDPKVCMTALDRFPTPAETHRLRELSSVELSNRMSVLQCQLFTYGSVLNARYDHSLWNIERLMKRCAQQTQTIKKQIVHLKQQNESTVHANEVVSRLTAELGIKTAEHKLSSWDKKHKKYRNERDALAMEKAQTEEELLLKSSEFNRAFTGVLDTTISVGVERGLRMDHTDEEFRGLSQKVVGFIPDAKEKFDRVVATFLDTTFPFLDKTSSATVSLRASTHIRHYTSSSRTFGHTSTPEHLKKKKKFVEK